MTTKQQSILPFRIEAMPSSDALTSHAGLPLVAETMRALGLEQAAREHLHLQQRNAGLSDYQKIESVVLLMAAGGDCYDDMAVLRADAGLQYSEDHEHGAAARSEHLLQLVRARARLRALMPA